MISVEKYLLTLKEHLTSHVYVLTATVKNKRFFNEPKMNIKASATL